MKIDREKLLAAYMEWVNKVADECEHKTIFHPDEIVEAIATLLETKPELTKE